MKTTPVRVKARTHQLLKKMAEHDGKPIAEVLEDAVERLRRGRVFEAADAAYRRAPRPDADLLAWENALADGLPEE